MNEEDKKTFKLTFKDQRRIINKEITLLDLVVEKEEEIERLKKENEELKHKLKLINSYVYGCNIDSLGSNSNE